MDVNIQTGNISTETGLATTSVSFANTVTANGDECQIVGVSHRASSDILSGITYNGVSLTIAVRTTVVASPIGASTHVAIGVLAGPATGSNTVVASFSSSADRVVCGAVPMDQVDQTTPSSATGTNNGNSANASVAVTPAEADSIVFAIFAALSQPTLSTGGGDVEAYNTVKTGCWGAGAYQTSPASPETIAWTLTSAFWCCCGVEIKAAGAAPPASNIGRTRRSMTGLGQ